MARPVLIIHGGAGGAFQDQRRLRRVRKTIRRILNLGYQKLSETNAVDAVTYVVRLLEDDPDFNAGTGSMLQEDGRARLSASVMDGSRMRFAAVINIEKIKNPVLVAQALLEEKSRVLAGNGAFRFAQKIGFKAQDTRTSRAIERWKKWKRGTRQGSDTVGACALDPFGHLAAATSSGGRGFEFPGRVSDSGMPIANFADDKCAISATGNGEEIIDEGLAVRIAQRLRDGLPIRKAFQRTFRELRVRKRSIGAIGLDRNGNVAQAKTTAILIHGWRKGKRRTIF
ncbi:MAG: hypothetical protein A3G87_07025 [Omnitrophica bacterium RIFCSPLOWO2_12_FULL_50_11]|nr:MAG: hypothetical protein A3G87_07025 [Omnitrophica bacterium RIFCSPLOWO2_12_FULL_50_11]